MVWLTQLALLPLATSALHLRASDVDRRALQASSSSANADAISDFCIGTNEFWSQFVVEPFKSIAEIRPKGTAGTGFFDVGTAAPETPQGIPRPVWLTILASAPSGLIWYGWRASPRFSTTARRAKETKPV